MHTQIGPGCLERVYTTCLAHLLRARGHAVETEVPIPVRFQGIEIMPGFRADLVVDGAVVVEVKSVVETLPVHHAQLQTYLRMGPFPAGLLVNFGATQLRDGYDRLVHPDYSFLPPSRLARLGPSGDSGPRE